MAQKRETDPSEAFRQDIAYLQLKDDVNWFMSDPRGRRFIARFLRTHGWNPRQSQTPFTGNSTTFKLTGRLEAATLLLELLGELETGLTYRMIGENFYNTEKTSHDRRDCDLRTD